ncbi:hypothetical protein G9A89_005430, partial [Geosiphon pyriformis]
IAYLLKTPVNIKSAREVFYSELIQNTNLPTNHNFVSIIIEINKEIEHYTQQRYSITYANKGKEKLQIPAKKTRVKSPTNPSYHYTPESVINITFISVSTSNTASAFGQFLFQSKQRKAELLGPYDFRISDLWEVTESEEEEEEETEDQEFTCQNLIAENPEFKTLNLQTHEEDDAQIWFNDIEKAIVANRWNNGRALQTITYFLKDTTDSWYQSLATKPQTFNEFKTEFLEYFSNNNSINYLTNTFTTIKQGDTEAVTTYLRHFHRNLHQIQTIQADYFTAPQILNQFIRELCSSILQRVCPMHPVDLPTAIIHARDFKAAKLKANHAQAVNLVINGSSDLDSKLKQFSNTINQKLEGYLADNHAVYQPPQ